MLFFLWQFLGLKTKILFPHDSWLYRMRCLEKHICTKFIKVKNQLIAMWGDVPIDRHFSEEWRYTSSKASQSWPLHIYEDHKRIFICSHCCPCQRHFDYVGPIITQSASYNIFFYFRQWSNYNQASTPLASCKDKLNSPWRRRKTLS